MSRNAEQRTFQSSLSVEREATARNWYMEDVFGEKRIAPVGVAFNTALIVLGFVVSAFYLFQVL